MKVAKMEKYQFYTWLRVELEKDENINVVNQWCTDSQCGKLVAKKTFSFKNEEEITMFCMRWVNK